MQIAGKAGGEGLKQSHLLKLKEFLWKQPGGTKRVYDAGTPNAFKLDTGESLAHVALQDGKIVVTDASAGTQSVITRMIEAADKNRVFHAALPAGPVKGMMSQDLFSQPMPNLPVMPGTLYFQAWYRDPAVPGGSSFNLSNGMEIMFVP